MRKVIAIVSWIVLPIAVIVVAFQYARDFAEESIK